MDSSSAVWIVFHSFNESRGISVGRKEERGHVDVCVVADADLQLVGAFSEELFEHEGEVLSFARTGILGRLREREDRPAVELDESALWEHVFLEETHSEHAQLEVELILLQFLPQFDLNLENLFA